MKDTVRQFAFAEGGANGLRMVSVGKLLQRRIPNCDRSRFRVFVRHEKAGLRIREAEIARPLYDSEWMNLEGAFLSSGECFTFCRLQ
jgi:hypothetical protein